MVAHSVCRELGSVAPAVLDEVARRCRTWTDDAFARWLGVDRSLVSHWRSGARLMPVEVLPLIAKYTGDPEAVYGDLLARAGARITLDAEPSQPGDPRSRIREVRRDVGALLVSWERATDPTSPGGEDLGESEATLLLGDVEDLIEDLGHLRDALKARRKRR